MITARADVVKMPPGHYEKIAQVLRDKIHTGGWMSGRPRPPCKHTRDNHGGMRYKKGVWIKKILEEAALDDPDDLHELWNCQHYNVDSNYRIK